MSELADELARHAKPEHVRELAAEKLSEWKERAKEAVAEKASEIKTHAKETVMHKTMEMKERADTPRGWSLLGAIIGAGVGAVLMKKAFWVREERSFGTGSDEFQYRGERYPAAEAAHSMKEKAHELKGQATHWFDRALESQPLMLALGSAALGVFASLILPVSNRERQLIEPAKRKAQESISHLGEQLEQKLQGQEANNVGSSTETMGTMGEDFSERLGAPAGSRIPPVPPLDDVSTKIH